MVLNSLSMYEPPPDLINRIMQRIRMEKQVSVIRKQVLLFSGFVAASLATLAIAVNSFALEASGSGFFQFFSLLFSDTREVLGAFQEFAFSFLESLPVFSVIALILSAMVSAYLLRVLVRDVRILYSSVV